MAVEHRIDIWIVVALVAILGASLATLDAVGGVVGSGLFVRQLFWGAGGLAVFFLLSRLQGVFYERIAPAVYGLSLIALTAVLFFGTVRGGTRGWFALGPVTVQPSEFARLGTMLMIAAWLGRRTGTSLSLGENLAVAVIVAVPVGLILFQPDLGVALTYSPLLFAALVVGGLAKRAWAVLLVFALIGSAAAWQWVLKPYQKERVMTLINPDRDPYGAGYQVRQSKIAVGSGGLKGQGLGHGSQSLLRFLPAQHTDFIFAPWAEATGLIGCTGLLMAYALLLARIGNVAAAAGSRHGLILALLVGTWLAFQLIVNLGMVIGWLPTTGITLPLFSYGGSSLLSTCAALGIVQSIWRHRLVNQ